MQQTYATQLANEAQKSGLEKTAQAHHLQAVTTDFLEQSAVVPGLADGSKMLAQAFTAKPKSAPQVTTTGEGFGVFQVLDVKAAHAPVFEEYKAKLLEDYRDQILPQMLATKTNAMAEMAHNGNDLEKAAKQFGAVVKTSDLVGMDAQVPDLGQLASSAPALFKLPANSISSAFNTGRTGFVAKILERDEPTEDQISANFGQTRDALLEQRREQVFAIFITSLQDKYQKDGLIRLNKKAQTPALPGSPS